MLDKRINLFCFKTKFAATDFHAQQHLSHSLNCPCDKYNRFSRVRYNHKFYGAVYNSEQCWAEEGFSVEEIKKLMYTCGSIKICFQPQEYNKVDQAQFILNENEVLYCIENGLKWFMESIKIDSASYNFSNV